MYYFRNILEIMGGFLNKYNFWIIFKTILRYLRRILENEDNENKKTRFLLLFLIKFRGFNCWFDFNKLLQNKFMDGKFGKNLTEQWKIKFLLFSKNFNNYKRFRQPLNTFMCFENKQSYRRESTRNTNFI